jgi:uncharacterized protein YmfQ (DUF2313 family)
MPLIEYTAWDYLAQTQKLLPRGRVWHRSLSLVQDADILTLMPSWARLTSRLNDLIAEIFPCTTTELLPEWEDTLGLPDPCVQPPLESIQQRRAAVCVKFVARGGQSKSYYIGIAAALGIEITITEFAQFRCGINSCGDALYGYAWVFTWRINAPLDSIVYFRPHFSTAGDALREWGNALLECIMSAIKPAHTILQIAFGGVVGYVSAE